ncbi:Uncharacterized conserved protein, DUF302 family [Virgibacillus subterraneus]|uniref:Uncharacterized conserved protein, DUF302 family n=2 Tax=Virgibacillus TaxID=84406 RepID=A0A1H1F3K3_9BACI|nr:MULTISPECIES: DUF302 domain-containing protein [Virgibacillus]SDQ95572.1 Uncharacterized conserved protein, DUF302 family [Virgibacillus salinus]SEQ96793.1 Uncharacterized conserved protein, DUF302 family [Virgibacillus subterraneus]
MFHYTVETTKSLEEAIQSLEQSLKEEKFGVLWQFDVKDTLQKKGFEFNQPFQVLEVCNPEEAQRVLSQNQLVGYFLPCKIVVYEDAGMTKIGMPKPTALIQMVEDESLNEIARDIENRMISSIDKSI